MLPSKTKTNVPGKSDRLSQIGSGILRCAAVLGHRNVIEPTALESARNPSLPLRSPTKRCAGFHSPASTHTTLCVNSTLLPPRTGVLLPPVCGRPRPQQLHPAHGAESARNPSLPLRSPTKRSRPFPLPSVDTYRPLREFNLAAPEDGGAPPPVCGRPWRQKRRRAHGVKSAPNPSLPLRSPTKRSRRFPLPSVDTYHRSREFNLAAPEDGGAPPPGVRPSSAARTSSSPRR